MDSMAATIRAHQDKEQQEKPAEEGEPGKEGENGAAAPAAADAAAPAEAAAASAPQRAISALDEQEDEEATGTIFGSAHRIVEAITVQPKVC